MYTTILSNNPKTIRKKAHILMNHENTKEIAASTSPNMSAFLGEIRPDGMGLALVLSIIASISRSL